VSIAAPPRDALERIAGDVRRFLEGVWPEWHRLRGRPLPDPLSLGTCQTSSLFLATALRKHGFEARVEQGNDPARDEGYFHDGVWHGHAWVSCGDWIVDVSADQFGRPPVSFAPLDDPGYGRGTDTAYESAKRQRAALVASALESWTRRRPSP
jgi:hypothetical protein